ncbi:HAMP domain-containing protein, partial [bacterium]|nr:HAMP domain-containing protein [bacterium]
MTVSLRKQLIITYFLFGVIPLLIISYYASSSIYSTIIRLTQAQFQEISDAISTDTLSLFSKKQAQLKLISNSNFFKNQMTKEGYLGTFLSDYLQDYLNQNPELDEIICLSNHSDKLKYYESTNHRRLKLEVPPEIQEKFNKGLLYSMDQSAPLLRSSQLRDEKVFSIFSPILDAENNQHLLQATIKLTTIQKHIKDTRIGGLSQSINHFIFVLDENDQLLYAPDFLFDHLENNADTLEQFKNKSIGEKFYSTFFQKQYLSYQYKINVFNWKIIILKNSEVTLKALDELTNNSINILIVLLIFITITSIFISRAIFNPINQLKEIAKDYSDGNFEQQLNLEGDHEIAQLAQSMMSMGEDLQKYTGDLHKTVQQRTIELQSSMVEVESAKAIADESVQIKSDFLGVASHELRTPLNGIVGTSELIADLADDP